MGLTLDPQLIRDLTVLITSSTVGGMFMEALRQPVINGYFIAGSVVGPGGLRLVKVGCTEPRLLLLGSHDLATPAAQESIARDLWRKIMSTRGWLSNTALCITPWYNVLLSEAAQYQASRSPQSLTRLGGRCMLRPEKDI